MKICPLNDTTSFLFHFFHNLITLFHFSPAGKKRSHLTDPFLCMFLRKQTTLQTLQGKQKYQVTNIGVEKNKINTFESSMDQ